MFGIEDQERGQIALDSLIPDFAVGIVARVEKP